MNTLNEQNNLIKTLKNLGLNGMAEAATNQFNNEFSYSELNFCQRLQELLEREDSYRKEMKYQRIIRQGKLTLLSQLILYCRMLYNLDKLGG